jgi:tRNA(fMet)-specific endonuclease VapC
VSAIVTHELYFGAYRSSRMAENLARLDGLRLAVLDFDNEDARHAGEVRAALAAAGTPIGPYDVLIAGQALARGMTLVTRNMQEFQRVASLRAEDWET